MQPDFDKLRARFRPEEVLWRVGPTTADKSRGMALGYVDARVVMDRLDEVCGPAGWQCRYSHANGKTVCDIGILCNVGGPEQAEFEWIWKADGAGDSEMEAEKGALSDAFKRAAVRWGIGRYLYELDTPWVAIEGSGRSFKIADRELPRLMELLGGKYEPPKHIAAVDRGAHGPLGITELKNKLKQFCDDLPACTEPDMLAGLLHSYDAVLKQCERDLPTWWVAPPNSDRSGIKARVEAQRSIVSRNTKSTGLSGRIQPETLGAG